MCMTTLNTFSAVSFLLVSRRFFLVWGYKEETFFPRLWLDSWTFLCLRRYQLQSFRQLLSLTGRPKDNGTRLPYSVILLWDSAFKFQRLVWSEAAYHFLTTLSFQNSTLSCSCRQYGNHRSIPSNAKVVSFWEIRAPWKWGLWKSSKGWCLFHRGQLVPVHHSEGQEIQQELGLGIKKRPASQCFSLIQPQSCMLLKGQ